MAVGITWSVTISGASGLSFNQTSSTYLLIPGTGLARLSARRQAETSPYMDGDAETSNVLDQGLYVLTVRCMGSSWAAAESAADALFAAVRQRSFTLAVTRDGVTKTWTCDAATGWEAPWNAELSWNGMVEVTASIPVHPIPS